MVIGERLKKFRADNLLTLKETAKIFGVSVGEIERLESGRNKPHFITIAKWEQKFKEIEKEAK